MASFWVTSKPEWMDEGEFVKLERQRRKRVFLQKHPKKWYWRLFALFV